MELVWMSNFNKEANLYGASICGLTALSIKIFMMYNLWQDIFVASGIAATFKNLCIYILFMSNNWLPIGINLMKYIGAPFNFSISTTTIWLAVFGIISEAFLNAMYREYKKLK